MPPELMNSSYGHLCYWNQLVKSKKSKLKVNLLPLEFPIPSTVYWNNPHLISNMGWSSLGRCSVCHNIKIQTNWCHLNFSLFSTAILLWYLDWLKCLLHSHQERARAQNWNYVEMKMCLQHPLSSPWHPLCSARIKGSTCSQPALHRISLWLTLKTP